MWRVNQIFRPVWRHFELAFWLLALVMLYRMPVAETHMSLCPLNALGLQWCPGCGLGHSLHYALHGQWQAAWQEHYLGFFALAVILYRIFQLVSYQLKPVPHESKDLQRHPRH